MINEKVGILISNLGTPASPSARDIRRFLKAFLSDPHVVKLPRLLWLPILYGVILPFRPRGLVEKYEAIFENGTSPLLNITLKQAQKLGTALEKQTDRSISVFAAMRYGAPSIKHALSEMKAQGIQTLMVLPLYPHYSESTTLSTIKAVHKTLKKLKFSPKVKTINNYAANEAYIQALANSITQQWTQNTPAEKLIFSFHGLPKKNKDTPEYEKQCRTTARLVAEKLNLSPDTWHTVFQSRLGSAEWLQPYCDKTLVELAQNNCKSVDVICPGFAADCLETLEEINITNREMFLNAGGKAFHYIPALNDSDVHIDSLGNLIRENLL